MAYKARNREDILAGILELSRHFTVLPPGSWDPTTRIAPPESIPSQVLYDFSLTVKAANLLFIPGRGSAISSAKEGKSGFIYNLVKS